MTILIVRFEMRFEKTERIDPHAATFTDRSTLLSLPNRNLLEHRCYEYLHGQLLCGKMLPL